MKRGWALLVAVLAGCSVAPPTEEPPRKGGYYKDDGPHEQPPPNVAATPDAEPKPEPLHRFANRPYRVFGNEYVPMAQLQPFRQRGVASWYGRRFHGQKTASGERYDMYAMTAAHPTLPIPSYARVTNLANRRSVVVRVNDRGPFHSARIIDLSYAAAYKLGFIQAGSAQVEVESVLPGKPPEPGPVYLQVGAFGSRENAETLRARIALELAWLQETVEVLFAADRWRLQLGPFRSAEDARSIAERIEAELELKPRVVVR